MAKKQTTIVPLGDRILVKPASIEDSKTASGIIIPDTVNREKPEQGEVIAVGEGRIENGAAVPLRIKKGDKVLFSKYGYDEVKINEEEFYILKEDSVLAIIK